MGPVERPRLSARLIGVFCGLVFLVIVLRLFTLQIYDGERYREASHNNFVDLVKVAHDRGEIVDKKGQILATNRDSVDVTVTPAFLQKRTESFEMCLDLLGFSVRRLLLWPSS